jgi:transposase
MEVFLRREPPLRALRDPDSCAANSTDISRDSSGFMSRMEVIVGSERRRRFSSEEKLRLVTEAFGEGASVADVARRAEICTSQLYRWRTSHRAAQSPAFLPAIIRNDAEPGIQTYDRASVIEVELTKGARLKIGANAPTALVEAVLRGLR